MIKPEILCKKRFKSSQIKVFYNPISNRKIEHGLEEAAKKTWNKVYKKAKKDGKKIWDSEIYRLNKWEANKRMLELEISTIPFSVRTGLKLQTNLCTFGEEYYPKLLFVSSLIKTKDNFYIFGVRSGKYINTHDIDLIGGVLSKSEKEVKSWADIENHLLSEIQEETGIEQKNISNNKFIGMILTSNYGICLQFFTGLALSKEKAAKIFMRKRDDELKDLKFIHSKKLRKFLENQDGYRKHLCELLDS